MAKAAAPAAMEDGAGLVLPAEGGVQHVKTFPCQQAHLGNVCELLRLVFLVEDHLRF
jgi:hypothetical protein